MNKTKMRVLTLFILIISHVFKPTHMTPIFSEKINEGSEVYLKTYETVATSENDLSKNPSTDDQSSRSEYLEESESFKVSDATTEDPEIKESTLESESLIEGVKFTSGYSDDRKNYSLDANFHEFHNSIEKLIFLNLTNHIDDFNKNIENEGESESDKLSLNSSSAITEKNSDENFTTDEMQKEEGSSKFANTVDEENIIDDETMKHSNISAPKSILSISFSISEDKKSQIDIMMGKGVDQKRYGQINNTFSHQSLPTTSQNSIFFLFNFGNYFYINTASANDIFTGLSGESSKNSSTSEKASDLKTKSMIYSTCTERPMNVVSVAKEKFHVNDEVRAQNFETTSVDSMTNDKILNIGTQINKHHENNKVFARKSSQDKKEFSMDHTKFSIKKTRFIDTNDQANESDDEDYIILEGSGWYNEEKYEGIKPLEKNWYQKLRMKREL